MRNLKTNQQLSFWDAVCLGNYFLTTWLLMQPCVDKLIPVRTGRWKRSQSRRKVGCAWAGLRKLGGRLRQGPPTVEVRHDDERYRLTLK